jgi:hypothetical protein
MLWGAGKKTAARLRELGFETIGDVARTARFEITSDARGLRIETAGKSYDIDNAGPITGRVTAGVALFCLD